MEGDDREADVRLLLLPRIVVQENSAESACEETKMKMRTRILIIKVLTILGMIIMVMFLISALWLECTPKEASEYVRRERIFLIIFIIYAIIGILLIILTCVGIKPEDKHLDKYDLIFSDAAQMRYALRDSAARQGYACMEDSEEWLVCHRLVRKKHYVFVLYFLREMGKEDIGTIYDRIYEILKKNGIDGNTEKTRLMLCITVNKVSSTFYSYLKCEIEQGRRLHQYYSGATLGGDIFYMPDLDPDINPVNVKKLKEETWKICKEAAMPREGQRTS